MHDSRSDFATTQWTLVWRAAKEDSQQGRPALEQVIRRYWVPLYSFARRRGLSREDAEDATQEFLQSIIRGDLLENADPARGKFRAYLLSAWKRYLVDFHRRQSAAKRGGSVQILSLDFEAGERRWLEIESKGTDADHAFHVAWANSLLDEVNTRLQQDYATDNRSKVFDKLLPRLTSKLSSDDYAALGRELKLSENAVRVALHRLRGRFGETLRSVVLETIDDEADIDSELGTLINLMAGRL